MSKYRDYQIKLGRLKELSNTPPSDIDPEELSQGEKEEAGEHHMSHDKAKLTALQHLRGKDQGHYYSGLEKAKKGGMLRDAINGGMVSPTAIPTPVIAIGIRGSSTGGLPSGMDQTGIASNTPTGRLGGYEPIPTAKDNSELIDKTPNNPQINSANPITNDPETSGTPHVHQIQQATGQSPQTVTGAESETDTTLTLKAASSIPQKTVDVDVSDNNEPQNPNDMDGDESMKDDDNAKAGLNEGKHKPGCKCGFCANKHQFGKKDEDDKSDDNDTKQDIDKKSDKKKSFFGKDKKKIEERLKSIREALRNKADKHPLTDKELALSRRITESLNMRSKTLNETFARHIKLMNESIQKGR